MLDLMKELLGIQFGDTNKDNILNHFLTKSQITIKNYCNIDEIPVEYEGTVVDLAIIYYKNRSSEGIKQQSQGSRSTTFRDGMPDSIKGALPLPKVKVIS